MPITIVLGVPEYCGILIILVVVIVVKSKRPATGRCTNPFCQSLSVNLEKELRRLHEMPLPNEIGDASEPPAKTSNPCAAFPSMATPPGYDKLKSGSSNTAIPETGYDQKDNAAAKMTGVWAIDTCSPEPEDVSTFMGNVLRTRRPGYENQSNCAFFTKLPLEIRNKVYEDLLISSETITPDQQLLGKTRKKQTYDRGYYIPAAGLDARILASCRAISYEAYPILYGRNTFSFDGAYQVWCFRSDALKDDCGMSIYLSIHITGSLAFFFGTNPPFAIPISSFENEFSLVYQLVVIALIQCSLNSETGRTSTVPKTLEARMPLHSLTQGGTLVKAELMYPVGHSERNLHLGLDYVTREEGRLALINKITLDMSKDPESFRLARGSLSNNWGLFLDRDIWFSAVECLYLDCSRRDFSEPGERLFVSKSVSRTRKPS